MGRLLFMVVRNISKLLLVGIDNSFPYDCHRGNENHSLFLPLPQGETKLDATDVVHRAIRLAVC